MDTMLMNQIKTVLEEGDIVYHCDEEENFIGAAFSNFSFAYHVRKGSLDYRLQISMEVPEEYEDEMLVYLNSVNEFTADGHWELLGDHVYFRVYTDRLVDKEVDDSRIRDVLRMGFIAEELFFDGIKQVAEGVYSGKDAFKEIAIKKIMGLMEA